MLSRLTTAALGALVILSGPPAARLRRVPADYPTIQEAIDSAEPGDTVLVAPGRYVENIRFEGKGIVVASDYVLKHDPAVIGRTIIDGSRPRHPDTASVVLMIDQEDTTAKLIGFTLTGGRGTIWTDARQKAQYREGGAVLCELGSPVIEHNMIEGNRGGRSRPGILSAGGGGIRCGYAEPIIRNNVIRNNRGEYGGGVVLYHSAGTVRNNLIAGNTGGGGTWRLGHLGRRCPQLPPPQSHRAEYDREQRRRAARLDADAARRQGRRHDRLRADPVPQQHRVGQPAGRGWADRSVRAAATELVANLVQDGTEAGADLTRDPQFADTVHYYLRRRVAGRGCGRCGVAVGSSRQRRARAPALGTRRADLGAYGGPGSAVLLP